jgi:hypothetical protein
MFRKLSVLCLSFVLCLGIVGCGSKKVEMPKEGAKPAPTGSPQNVPTAPPATVPD